MKKILHLTISLLVFCYTSMSIASHVLAQSVGLSISPPVVEIILSPNKKVVQTFTLKNQGEDVNLTLNLRAVTPNDSEGHVNLDSGPISPSKIPLVATISPHDLGTTFILKSGESLPLVLSLEGATVDAPIDTYLALVVEASSISNRDSLTAASAGISSLVFITLTPSAVIPANLEIENFDPPLFHDSATPLTLRPTIKNSADIMIRPTGSLEIISPQGKLIYTMPLYPNLLLKDSKRIIEGSTSSTPPQVSPLSWTPRWTNFGPHRLRLTLKTEGGTTLTQVEKQVWLLPIRSIVAGILLAIILTTLITNQRKTLDSKSDKKSE